MKITFVAFAMAAMVLVSCGGSQSEAVENADAQTEEVVEDVNTAAEEVEVVTDTLVNDGTQAVESVEATSENL